MCPKYVADGVENEVRHFSLAFVNMFMYISRSLNEFLRISNIKF